MAEPEILAREASAPGTGALPPLPADALIIVPARNMVLFPGLVLPVTIGRPSSIAAAQEAMGLWYWGPDFPDPADYLNFLPGALVGLRAGWVKGADPALEAMGVTAASTTQNSTRQTLYQQIQRSMNSSGPFMPLIQPAQILVGATSVKNLQSNALWLVNLSELG